MRKHTDCIPKESARCSHHTTEREGKQWSGSLCSHPLVFSSLLPSSLNEAWWHATEHAKSTGCGLQVNLCWCELFRLHFFYCFINLFIFLSSLSRTKCFVGFASPKKQQQYEDKNRVCGTSTVDLSSCSGRSLSLVPCQSSLGTRTILWAHFACAADKIMVPLKCKNISALYLIDQPITAVYLMWGGIKLMTVQRTAKEAFATTSMAASLLV